MKTEIVRKNINTGEWEHYVSSSVGTSHWSPGLTSNSSLVSTKKIEEISLYNLDGNIQIYEDIVYGYTSLISSTFIPIEYTLNDTLINQLNQKQRKLNDSLKKQNETIQNLIDLTESEAEDLLQVEGLLFEEVPIQTQPSTTNNTTDINTNITNNSVGGGGNNGGTTEGEIYIQDNTNITNQYNDRFN